MRSAFGTSVIVSKCMVRLHFHDERLIEAYHTPNFSTNILSVGRLALDYSIRFTYHHFSSNGLSMCIISYRKNDTVFLQTVVRDGL